MIRIRSLSYYLFLLTFLSGDLLLGQITAQFEVADDHGNEEVAASFTVIISEAGSFGALNYTIDASGTAVQRVGNIGNYDFQLGNGRNPGGKYSPKSRFWDENPSFWQ